MTPINNSVFYTVLVVTTRSFNILWLYMFLVLNVHKYDHTVPAGSYFTETQRLEVGGNVYFFWVGRLQFICPSARRMVCCLLKWSCWFWCSLDELLYYDVYFLDQNERTLYDLWLCTIYLNLEYFVNDKRMGGTHIQDSYRVRAIYVYLCA